MHTVKWFLVLKMIKYFYLTYRWDSNRMNLGQSGPGSNDNEELLHILQSSNTGASSSDGLVSYLGHSLRGCLSPLYGYSQYILQPQLTGLF